MKLETLNLILILSAIALGFGVFLTIPLGKGGRERYDERQRMEQGKAANLAMNTSIAYLLALYGGMLLEWLPEEDMLILTTCGMVLTLVVYCSYCIFHDAYLGREEDPVAKGILWLVLGGVWMLVGISNWSRQDGMAGIQMLMSFNYLSIALCLLARGLFLRWQARCEDEE